MTGNVLTNDFYHNMLEAKCSVLKDLIQNKEACDRYERLSHITNKIEPSAEPDGAHLLKLWRYSYDYQAFGII